LFSAGVPTRVWGACNSSVLGSFSGIGYSWRIRYQMMLLFLVKWKRLEMLFFLWGASPRGGAERNCLVGWDISSSEAEAME
jgi:hypothetical protein